MYSTSAEKKVQFGKWKYCNFISILFDVSLKKLAFRGSLSVKGDWWVKIVRRTFFPGALDLQLVWQVPVSVHKLRLELLEVFVTNVVYEQRVCFPCVYRDVNGLKSKPLQNPSFRNRKEFLCQPECMNGKVRHCPWNDTRVSCECWTNTWFKCFCVLFDLFYHVYGRFIKGLLVAGDDLSGVRVIGASRA